MKKQYIPTEQNAEVEDEERRKAIMDACDRIALEMIRKKGKWKIEAPNKMARAISKGGWYILHLQEGTVRNETCAKEFVKYLNEMEKTRKERYE